jgi:TRAP-type C4-dicarboxylate transport system permease small subunit
MSRSSVAFEEALGVACMALLVVITLLNVVTRYFTDESFAWTEEISVFLMVVMTLAGASAASGRDRHIRIEYFYDRGSVARQRFLRVFSGCCCGLLFLGLAALFARVVADEIHYAETSMGLGIPRWWFTVFSPMMCLGIALRSFAVAWSAARQPLPSAGGQGAARKIE